MAVSNFSLLLGRGALSRFNADNSQVFRARWVCISTRAAGIEHTYYPPLYRPYLFNRYMGGKVCR
jgi:hypothetical protein